jgi:membrane-bound inhibitor of C-type lysozyme
MSAKSGRPSKRIAAALALGLCLLAAPAQAEPYVNYACADGAKLSLIFEKSESALVMVEGGALRLQNRHPASGLWYASSAGELRAKGAKATFRMAGRARTTCLRVR